MNSTVHDTTTSRWPGSFVAAAIMLCAAATFFLVHGFATGWNLTSELWDTGYYFQIARSGYHSAGDRALAFLPGYPILLMPAAHLLTWQPFLASFLTSTLLGAIAGALLFRLLRKHMDTWTSLAGIALLAFSPFSIYLYNGYSEPAFFLCVALTLTWLGNGRLLLAAAATGYAFLCRPYAIALVPLFAPAAWRLLRERDFWTLGRVVALGAVPGLLYAGWMYHAFGDPFIAFKTLAHWKQYESISSAWPWPIRAMYGFYLAFRDSASGSAALSLIAFFLGAIAVLASASRLPCQLVAYSLLLLACVALGDGLDPVNLGRHSLLAFAAFPGIAAMLYSTQATGKWASRMRHCTFAVALLFFAALFTVMAVRFSQGLWVS